MHSSHVQCKRHGLNVRDMAWMFNSMSIYQKDSKGEIKSNFVTSYLAFRDSIPIAFFSSSK